MRRFFVFFLIFLLPLQLIDQSYFDSSPQPTTYVPHLAEVGVFLHDTDAAATEAAVDLDSQQKKAGSLEPDLSDSVDLRLAPALGHFATAPPSAAAPAALPHLVYSVLEPPRG